MDLIYLTGNSIGRLAPTLLTSVISVYLLCLEKKTDRTRFLTGYFILVSVFNLGYLYSYSILDPVGRWGWYLVASGVFAVVFKTRFVYHLPRNSFPREEPIAARLSFLLVAAAFVEYLIRAGLATRFYPENQHYGSPFVSSSLPIVTFLIFAWGMIVLVRQALRSSRGRRTALVFLGLAAIELLLSSIVLLQSAGVLTYGDAAITAGMNLSMLILYFLYALFYLNVSGEPSSFIARLVGISMITMLAAMSGLGMYQMLEFERSYDQARMADARQAIGRGASEGLSSRPDLNGPGGRRPGTIRRLTRLDQDGQTRLLYSQPHQFADRESPRAKTEAAPKIDRRNRQIDDSIYAVYRLRHQDVFSSPGDAVYEVAFDYRSYREALHSEAVTYFFTILLTTAFMLAVFPLFFRDTVTRPLRQLLGRLQAEGPELSEDDGMPKGELVLISRKFSRMMALLKEAKSQYYDYSDHLEEVEQIITSQERDAPANRDVDGRHLLYTSQAMREVILQAEKFASTDRAVLVTGETGTGKELIARLIHHAGERAGQPFLGVNCAAIAESLWESEVFGHVRGAFTGAASSRSGRVGEAGGGTLFFDEIGEMPLEMQAKMLRLLQERSYCPVGGDTMRAARCRFLFATNRDLVKMIDAGEFREDLYYRINVLHMNIPPLRERRSDIPVLAQHILKHECNERGIQPPAIDAAARKALVAYEWPGNIRELENVLVRALTVVETDSLAIGDLPAYIKRAADSTKRAQAKLGRYARSSNPEKNAGENDSDFTDDFHFGALRSGPRQGFDDILKNVSRRLIQNALREAGGNRSRAAEILGIKRSRLRYQMKELGIEA